MIVVSDTTAISNLLTIGSVNLLQRLFDRVLVPTAVYAELLAWHDDPPDWLEVVPAHDVARVTEFQQSVHVGEAEAIALALEIHPDWLLIDDSDGRKLARRCGLPVMGLLGCLLLARKRGLISQVRDLLDRLQNESGFYLHAELRQEVLRLAGESE